MEHAQQAPVRVQACHVAVVLLEDVAEERLAGARRGDHVGLPGDRRAAVGATRASKPVHLRERPVGALPPAGGDLGAIQLVDALGGRHDAPRVAEQGPRERAAAGAHEAQRRYGALERARRVVLRLRGGRDTEAGAYGPLDRRQRAGGRATHSLIGGGRDGGRRSHRDRGQEQCDQAH